MPNFEHDSETISSKDGTNLFVQSWLPSAAAAAAHVLVVHGYLEHGGRYAEVAEYLAAQKKIAVTVFDFRGHGKSDGYKAFCKSYQEYQDDMLSALQHAATKTPKNVPLFVLGHSNGGLVALNYYLNRQIADTTPTTSISGLLLSSPWLAPADALPYVKVLASKVLGYCLPKLSMSASEVTGETLTHDAAKIKEHDQDELNLTHFTVGWARQSLYAQAAVLKDCGQGPKVIAVPVFFVYAEHDLVANAAVNKEFAQQIEQEDKTVVERKGAHHEVLNETDRVELYDTIAKWILDHAKK